jgi:hypothetical protein
LEYGLVDLPLLGFLESQSSVTHSGQRTSFEDSTGNLTELTKMLADFEKTAFG